MKSKRKGEEEGHRGKRKKKRGNNEYVRVIRVSMNI